eukprot:2462832-Amphidinium_carterae.1
MMLSMIAWPMWIQYGMPLIQEHSAKIYGLAKSVVECACLPAGILMRWHFVRTHLLEAIVPQYQRSTIQNAAA